MKAIVCALMAMIMGASGYAAQRVRYGPGVCGPIDPNYVKMATETGGQPFPMSSSELGKSSRVMLASFLSEMVLWASGDVERTYSIPVDPSIARMMFSGTFDTTGGSLTLVAPDGTVVQQAERVEDTLLNCGRVTTIDAPASGIWQVRVAPSGRFWLTVHAKSDRSLAGVDFVALSGQPESKRFVTIEGEPIAGKPATLRVSVSATIKSPTFELVSLDGQSLQSIALQSTDNLEFSGTITLPTEPFRVLVTDRDEAGIRTQRIWPALFHGEAIEVVPPAGSRVSAGTDMSVVFTIRNHGAAVRLTLVASDHHGKVVPVEPATLELGAAAEGRAAVRLTVPADAPPASEASIRLTATSDATAATGGFNSASKTFTVVRE